MASQPDRRRFNGPETSRPITRVSSSSASTGRTQKQRPLVDGETGLREDGRRPGELRPIFLKTGLVPQASGSAYIETGRTKIVCAVYGPHPARRDAPYSARAKLSVEAKFAPFACPGRRRAPGKDTEAPGLAAQLAQALLPSLRLDLLPKSALDLYVTVLECDGPAGDISSGITAASVALAQAGVEMYGLVVGCCASIAPAPSSHADADAAPPPLALLDPSAAEADRAQGVLSFACMPALGAGTGLAFSGRAPPGLVKETVRTMQKVCEDIHRVAADALLEGREQERQGEAAQA